MMKKALKELDGSESSREKGDRAREYMKGNPLCCQITLTADECEHSDPATDAVRRVKEKKYE